MSSQRLPSGGRIKRGRPVEFFFNGRRYEGFEGDTLASGLLANGLRLFGRSFKYHRPRGVFGSGSEEPNAIVHLWALHIHKSNNPLGVEMKTKADSIPFHPYYTIKDMVGLGVFLMVYFWFVFFAPDFFGEPDNYIEADPLVTPPHIVPEWYFLPFYAILRAIPDKLGGVIAMFAGVAILFILPWMDRGRVRSARFRPIYRQFFWIFLADCILLGYIGAQVAEEPYVTIGRFATAYYFAHFLIICPLICKFERPIEPPESISAGVLKAGKGE